LIYKALYLLNALISFGIVVYYFETTLSKVNQKHLMILIFTTITSASYCLQLHSKSVETYLTVYIVNYAGVILSTIIMVLIIAELCGYGQVKFLRNILLVYGLVIFCFVVTIPYNQLYYKSYEFAIVNGLGYLSRTYGPCHSLFLILVFGSDLLSFYMILKSFFSKRAISIKLTLLLLAIFLVTTIIYFIPRILHTPIDLAPISFTIMDFLFLNIFKRAGLYDMSSNLLSVYEKRTEFGYIAFDKKFKFAGASELALLVFPELKNIKIDSPINCHECDLTTKLLPWLKAAIANQKILVYTKGETTVQCSVQEITSGDKVAGFLVEMRDITQQQHYIDLINTYNAQLETKVNEKTQKIEAIQDSIISGMATMVESRDNSTGGHIKRTSEGVKIFINELVNSHTNYVFTDNFCKKIIKAAPMHDLGKIAVDDKILRKPGKFEPEEYEQMKKHSAEGAKIVSQVLFNVDDEEFVQIAVNVAHYHHEKWNGSGYPAGLKGEEIPIEARIMAFADVFDALVSKRCYKDSFTYDKAFDIISNDLGSHFDPELGKVFLKCRPQLEEYYSSIEE